MFLVDTNVLVYATNEELGEHRICRRHLEEWRTQDSAWFTTWGVLYEFLRVISHPRVLSHPWPLDRAVGLVESLLASPGLVVLAPTTRHPAVLALTVKEVPRLAGSVVHDLHTAVLMREHGIRRIVTRDSDFRRFPFLEVIDPLRPDWPDAVRERGPKGSRRSPRSKARA